MHLADYVAILKNHLLVTILAGLAVFAFLAGRTLFKNPVYHANVTIQLETNRDPGDLLGELLAVDRTIVTDAEMEVMRSLQVATGAANRLEPNDFLVEHNAYRPLERLLLDYNVRRAPYCDVRVDVAKPTGDDPGGSFVFRFGKGDQDGLLFLRQAGDDEIDGFQLVPDFEPGRPFEAFGRTFTLHVEGEPAGRTFTLDLWPDRRVAGWIRSKVVVGEIGQRTGIISLGCNAPTPHLARVVADALGESYVDEKSAQKKRKLDQAVKFLKHATADVRAKLEAAEQELDQYRTESGAMLFSERGKLLVERIGELEFAKTELEHAVREQERLADEVGTGTLDDALLAVDAERIDPVTSALATRLAELEAQRDSLALRDVTPEHPAARRLDDELEATRAKLKGNLARLVDHRLRQTRARLRQTETAIASYDEEVLDLPVTERRLVELKRRVEAQLQSFAFLTEKQQEAEIGLASEIPSARVLDRASEPKSRRSPRLFKEILIAAIFGAAVGIGVAFAREYLDRSIKSPQELEEGVGVQLYAALPLFRSVKSKTMKRIRSALVTVEHPKSVLAENYRTLRANIRFANLEGPLQSFAITSSMQGEGKTVTTMNLAVVLAQGGSRVVVVDADMRRPAAHALFRDDLGPGFVDVLTGRLAWRDVLRDTSVETLKTIYAGGKPSNPWALLDSETFDRLLAELRQEFDFVLFDVPPVLAVADSASFFPKLDGVFLLARSQGCSIEVVQDARDQIERIGANLVGVIFNGFDARKAMRRGYGAYGYYGYYGRYGKYGGYGYGYGYGEEPEPRSRRKAAEAERAKA